MVKTPTKDEEIMKRVQFAESRGITLTSPFTKMSDKHDWLCLTDACQHSWSTSFNNVHSKKSGCPRCSGNFLTEADIKVKLEEMRSRGIECLEPYKKSLAKHLFGCLKSECLHKWNATFDSVSRSHGCPKCFGRKLGTVKRLTPERVENILIDFYSRNIEMLDIFYSCKTTNNFRCLISDCNYKWSTSFEYVKNGTGCPKCSGNLPLTEDEKIIAKAHHILRQRLSRMFYKGQTPTKVYRDSDGNLNQVYHVMFAHWEQEYKQIPTKPSNGIWHLDHIIPVSWFDPYDIEQLKLCWHHKNCQWLTDKDNLKKGDKIRLEDLETFTDWHYSAVRKASYRKPLPNIVS